MGQPYNPEDSARRTPDRERDLQRDPSWWWVSVIREYAELLGIDTTREGDEPGQLQVLHAIQALLARAEKAERERDDWRGNAFDAYAAAHGLDWKTATPAQIAAMEAEAKAAGDTKAMDVVRRLYAKWNAAVYDADKVRAERDRAERERDEAVARAELAERALRGKEQSR